MNLPKIHFAQKHGFSLFSFSHIFLITSFGIFSFSLFISVMVVLSVFFIFYLLSL